MTTDLSPVYTTRKADIIDIFPEAFFWKSQQEEAHEKPQGAVFSTRLQHLGSSQETAHDSVFGISHSICVDGKHSFSLRKTGRVVDFADSGFSSSFSQVKSDPKTQTKTPKLLKFYSWLFMVELKKFGCIYSLKGLLESCIPRGTSNLEETISTLSSLTLVDFPY